jgi:hypothetical protein
MKEKYRTNRGGRDRADLERRVAESLFVAFLFFLEISRVSEPENLAAAVTGKDAIRALRLERDDGYVPRPGSIGRSHAPARQTFERFELEDGRLRSYVTYRSRWT